MLFLPYHAMQTNHKIRYLKTFTTLIATLDTCLNCLEVSEGSDIFFFQVRVLRTIVPKEMFFFRVDVSLSVYGDLWTA